jgi:hypothetical protein
MPLVSSERLTQYWEPVSGGPSAQADLSTLVFSSPQTTIPLSSNWTSSVINADGFKFITVAATSTQAGSINVQLYVDAAGTIKQGNALTVALGASPLGVLNVNGTTTPFQSFTAQITNTSGTTAATITGYALLLTAQ